MADPGPQWLIWAHQMKTDHSGLVKQVQQNTEAVAHARLLEEQIKQLTVSHSALHDETKRIRVDLQALSGNLGEVEKHCDAEFRNTSRRLANLEEQSGTLGFVERRKSQAETALQRQRQETPERWIQQAHDLAGLREYQRQENHDRKNEIDELRAHFEKLAYAMNKRGNS